MWKGVNSALGFLKLFGFFFKCNQWSTVEYWRFTPHFHLHQSGSGMVGKTRIPGEKHWPSSNRQTFLHKDLYLLKCDWILAVNGAVILSAKYQTSCYAWSYVGKVVNSSLLYMYVWCTCREFWQISYFIYFLFFTH